MTLQSPEEEIADPHGRNGVQAIPPAPPSAPCVTGFAAVRLQIGFWAFRVRDVSHGCAPLTPNLLEIGLIFVADFPGFGPSPSFCELFRSRGADRRGLKVAESGSYISGLAQTAWPSTAADPSARGG